ncbi:hypothetical protein Nepgr_018773 [Nepenthes gracilis]|uniref:Uncharacterized protein n=1 Tax=Nepenthes gracilis TaxID=150966 RepID=A0AAD3XTG0_NEPGR|nr:hypothetical protein Nepgr_018773 [Nepenthes gracilis]
MLEVLRFTLFILLGVECSGCPLCWVMQSGQDAISICSVGCLTGMFRATYRMWCCHIVGCKIWPVLVGLKDPMLLVLDRGFLTPELLWFHSREVYLVTFPSLVFVEAVSCEGCSVWTVWRWTLATVVRVLLPGIRLKAGGLLPALQPVAPNDRGRCSAVVESMAVDFLANAGSRCFIAVGMMEGCFVLVLLRSGLCRRIVFATVVGFCGWNDLVRVSGVSKFRSDRFWDGVDWCELWPLWHLSGVLFDFRVPEWLFGSGAIAGSVVLIAALSLAGQSAGPGCLLKPAPCRPVGAKKDQHVMVCRGLLRLYCIARGPVWKWEYCVLQKAVLDFHCYSGWTPMNLTLAAYLQCSKLPAVLWVKLLGWH